MKSKAALSDNNCSNTLKILSKFAFENIIVGKYPTKINVLIIFYCEKRLYSGVC